MVQIAPSMLAADFLHLEKDVQMVNDYADLFHLDIMDGVFVPNLSYGFPVVEAIASMAKKPLDVHLMIEKPERYIDNFIDAGADIVTFHIEALDNIVELEPGESPIDYINRLDDEYYRQGYRNCN